ncbi:MAG: ribosomal protein S18-alanine N-acetyltransferase [Dehalococcoidales bacterium]|nr:ribosomal protein S18-alanine N-acetyltransferase [Dehalococcoidales bacterium]
MAYIIRPMTQEDLAQVNNIDREAFPTQWPPPNYRQELQNKLAYYIVATDDSRSVDISKEEPRRGLLGVLSRMIPFHRRSYYLDATRPEYTRQYIIGFSGIWVLVDEAHITNIALRQRYQGKGLGELLLIATVDLAKTLKARVMTLEVRASNEIAQKLYGKYGFEKVGLRRGYYLDNREDAVIMTTESITAPSFQARLEELREALAKKLNSPPSAE